MTPAQAYVRKIRNASKRAYAETCLQWFVGGERGDVPERPAGLSVMGAQAARMRLREIIVTPAQES